MKEYCYCNYFQVKKLRVREVTKLPEILRFIRGRDCIQIKAVGSRAHLPKLGLYCCPKVCSKPWIVTWERLVP